MRLVEKYRPRTFDDMVGQQENVVKLKRLAEKGFNNLPHLMFIGPPGTGKTTAAKCLATELWGDQGEHHFKEFNASDERGIDVVRNKYKVISKHKGRRILFLDEADQLTPDAQHSMRRTMELTSSTIFILSGNNMYKFIDAIVSRCTGFRFGRISDDEVLRGVVSVCKSETNADLTDNDVRETLTEIALGAKGDMRRALNTLEKLITAGKELAIENVLMLRRPDEAAEVISMAIEGDFNSAKKKLENLYIDRGFNHNEIIEVLYDGLDAVPDKEVKIRLYKELGETSAACRYGNNPLIQLIRFVAYCWAAPRLMRCPALESER